MIGCFEDNADGVECDRAYDSLVLLLADVWRYLALYLAGAEGHRQGLCHILLYTLWNIVGVISWANPNIGWTLVFEFTLAKLCEFGA
jgi:hypothetical protein